MANHMSEVAKMLNVELGEIFEINENENWICCFTKDSFVVENKSKAYINPSLCEHILASLLGGVYTIKRKPWKPVVNNGYYYICEDGTCFREVWVGDEIDIILYKIGNCYRTEEEAEANRDKWIAFYASDKVLEV